MPYSQEVRFKIGGDLSPLSRSLDRAPSMAENAGRKFEQAFTRGRRSAAASDSLSRAEGAKLDREFAMATRRVKAEKDLSDFRKRSAYQEADTVGRIKLVTGDLARLAQTRAKFEEGSVQWLKAQLQIEEKMAALRGLQRQQQQNNLRDTPSLPSNQTREAGGPSGMAFFRAIGTTITFALERALAWQRSRISVAQSQEASTAAGVESLRGRFAAIGGLRGQLRQGRARERDLEILGGFYQGRADTLSGKPDAGINSPNPGEAADSAMRAFGQRLMSFVRPEELTKAEEEIQRINAELQKQHDENALTERELNRQLETYSNQRSALQSVNRLQEKGLASSIKLLEVERSRLTAQKFTESYYGTPESQKAVQVELDRNRNELQAARAQQRARLLEVRQTITEDVAGGRRPFANGGRRPRSEAERLAARAADYRARARDIEISQARGESTGASVGFYINAGRRLESTVSGRMSRATAGAPQTPSVDFGAIKTELATANQTLSAIASSLTEVEVGQLSRLNIK